VQSELNPGNYNARGSDDGRFKENEIGFRECQVSQVHSLAFEIIQAVCVEAFSTF
jgi:hypothetical protein